MAFGLIFDVDGVIADTESLSARATVDAVHYLSGMSIPFEASLKYTGQSTHAHLTGLKEEFGLDIDLGDLRTQCSVRFSQMVESGSPLTFPGVLELAATFREHPNWVLGVATSSQGDRCRCTLRAAGLDSEMFTAVLTGDLATHPKPHPEIYLSVASELGVAPDQCVAIEDSTAGVAAAKAAGMQCIAVTNSFPREKLHAADCVVDSLEEVQVELVEAMVGQNVKGSVERNP